MILLQKKIITRALALLAWGGSTLSGFASDSIALHEAYADDFLIGTIIPGGLDPQATFTDDSVEIGIMTNEFNVLTAENCMKPMFVQPQEGEFFFKASDYCVDFAEANSMELVGHTLVWHAMTAEWIFKGKDGQAASREQLIERMRTHIHTVVGRYKGRIKYWDVLNEAVVMHGELGPAKLRSSPWLNIIGEDYIEMAFRFAHEADPEAILYYNDYNMAKQPKADFVLAMVQDLRAKGVPIHGVGLQGHWSLDWPSISQIEYTLQAFAEAGIPLSITELDISVLPMADSHRGADVDDNIEFAEKYNPFADAIPRSVLDTQAIRYAEIFELFLKYREHIERVSFWGTSDGQSWKNEYPMKGRTDYPVLFDRRYQAKPAYEAIIQLPNED